MKKLLVALVCLLWYFVSYQLVDRSTNGTGFGRCTIQLDHKIKSMKDIENVEQMLSKELKVNKGLDCRVCLLYFCKM